MYDIFISYAREDLPRVKELLGILEKQGWSVFWDRRIPTGKTWRSHIGQALENARCIIVIWSKYSTVSDWVNEEADEGKKRGILIPILLDSVQPPHGFREIQAADLTDYKSGQSSEVMDSLFADISLLLEQEPKPIVDINNKYIPDNQLYKETGKKEKIKQSILFSKSKFIIFGIVILIVTIAIYSFFHIRQDPVIKKVDNVSTSTNGGSIEKTDDPGRDIMAGDQNPKWLIVVSSTSEPDITAIERKCAELINSGFDVKIIESKDYPKLGFEFPVCALGPFDSKEQAVIMLRRVKGKLPEAYIKQGR